MSTASLDGLMCELDRWAETGVPARLWIRDDDAVAATTELDDFLAVLARHDVSALIATIPNGLQPSLAARLAGLSSIAIGVHGFAHRSHVDTGERRSEFPQTRDRAACQAELARGREIVHTAFPTQAIEMFVPPWNRIYRGIVGDLNALGYRALSTFAKAHVDEALTEFAVINTHVDIMHWRGTRRGRPLDVVAKELAEELAQARVSGGAPIGLLTHHLVHDAVARATLAGLIEALACHRAVHWVHPRALMHAATS